MSLVYLDKYKTHVRNVLTKTNFPMTTHTNIDFTPEQGLAFTIKNNQISIAKEYRCYENRNSSIHKLLQDTASVYNLPDISFFVEVGDNCKRSKTIKMGFSATRECIDTIMFPSFLFDHWTSTGLTSYKDLCVSMAEKNATTEYDSRINKLLWAGALSCHTDRSWFNKTFGKHPNIDFRCMSWQGPVPKDNERFTRKSSSFIPISGYSDYKYALDIQGCGFSARVAGLLQTGALLCFLERGFVNEFYMDDFIPGEDYILLKKNTIQQDVTNLFLDENMAKNKGIARNGYNKARDLLHYDNILFNIKNVLDDVHLHRG